MRNKMKRYMAAALCAAMMGGLACPAALAEATPAEAQAEPLVELIAPVTREAEPAAPAEPVTPAAPAEPVAPAEPKTEEAPLVELIVPAAPVTPVEPAAPVTPVEPAAPVTPVEPAAPVTSVEPVAPPVLLAPVTDSDDGEKVYSPIKADVAAKDGTITVTITEASGEPVYVLVGEDFAQNKYKGESIAFSGLEPGEYEIEVDYMEGTNVFRTVITLAASGENAPSGGETEPSGGENAPSGGENTPSGGAEMITPPSGSQNTPSTGAPAEVKAFTIQSVVSGSSVSSVIEGASDREVEVALLDMNGNRVGLAASIGSGVVKLGDYSAGTYLLRAQYVTPVQNADGTLNFMTVTAQAVVAEGVTADPAPTTPVDIAAKVETGKDYVIVTVTDSADADMLALLGGFAPKAITKGGSVRFDGLAAGAAYELEVDYVNPLPGASPFRTSVTIEAAPALSAIQITAVTAGENTLTVSGKAAAGQQVMISTTPASADVYALADASGVFSAKLSCAAGAYTAVTVRYVSDSGISASLAGNWQVTAPAAKPTLTVDAIDITSTTVVAKTAAGVAVELKTGDYTQKVIADDSGIVRFSLPHTYAAKTVFTFTVYYGNNLSFQQTATVAAVPYLGTLKYGDKGEDVRTLTARLEALGYPTDTTSRYGSTVREAVRLFQRANGLTDDGIAGPDTQRALFSVSAIAYGTGKYPTLVRGDRGYALIYTLQQRLKDLGYYTIKVDGIFGSGTQRAVRLFQQMNGLSVTGKADNATQTLLYSAAAKPVGSGISGEYQTLSRSGKYKSRVVPLQKRLRELGYYSGNIDGYFGSQTYRAVRNFQRRNGLTASGIADAYTQQVLYSAAAKAASGSSAGSSSSSSSSSSSTGYRLLYWGCRGDAVKKLQNALIDAGYKSYVRTADGIFGQWTYDAVRAYQKANGLAVDGIAGKNTQNALYGTSY